MPPSHRIPVLAEKIAAHVRAAGFAPGMRLTERGLAAQFDMSRSPVREALKLLAEQHIVMAQGRGGYVVGSSVGDAPVRLIEPADVPADEARYLQFARDHLDGQLPARVSENGLIRRYGLTRPQISRILHRAAHEGWAERLPGHGWRILPVLASAEAYAQGYRFRLLVEPAGILEPGFVADSAALTACRARQVELQQHKTLQRSLGEMFDIASDFHEVVMRCSHNVFFIDGLIRLNRLRRLIEYRKTVDRGRWLARCSQHLEVLDLLLAGDRPAAASLLRDHLRQGALDKSPPG